MIAIATYWSLCKVTNQCQYLRILSTACSNERLLANSILILSLGTVGNMSCNIRIFSLIWSGIRIWFPLFWTVLSKRGKIRLKREKLRGWEDWGEEVGALGGGEEEAVERRGGAGDREIKGGGRGERRGERGGREEVVSIPPLNILLNHPALLFRL